MGSEAGEIALEQRELRDEPAGREVRDLRDKAVAVLREAIPC